MTGTPSDPDEVLAAKAQSGDQLAFEALIRRHKVPLYRFVRSYVGETDDAYDVLQDTFISAWSALGRYDAKRSFLPWLRVIALNKCRDYGRRQTVRRLLMLAHAREITHIDEAAVVDREANAVMVESERLIRLDAAIANLPAAYKEPLLLTTVGGLSQQEAAEVLKISAKALEMRLYRARRKLVDDLGS